MPVRISETLVSCRDLIRRQHQCFIALPLLSASTDVQEVHTRVIMPSLCVFSMLFLLKHASALLHPVALYLRLPVEFLPTPEKKSGDEEVQEYMRSHSYLHGGGN